MYKAPHSEMLQPSTNQHTGTYIIICHHPLVITIIIILLLLSYINPSSFSSVPAGVHWRASPEGMPLWGPNRFWPGSGLVLRCLGPGFIVLALGPGFRPIFIHSIHNFTSIDVSTITFKYIIYQFINTSIYINTQPIMTHQPPHFHFFPNFPFFFILLFFLYIFFSPFLLLLSYHPCALRERVPYGPTACTAWPGASTTGASTMPCLWTSTP